MKFGNDNYRSVKVSAASRVPNRLKYCSREDIKK